MLTHQVVRLLEQPCYAVTEESRTYLREKHHQSYHFILQTRQALFLQKEVGRDEN